MEAKKPSEPEFWTKVAKNKFDKDYFLSLVRKMNVNAKRPIF